MLYNLIMDEMLEADLRRSVGSTASKKTSIFNTADTDVPVYVQMEYVPAKVIHENTLKGLVLNQSRNLRRRSVGVTTLNKSTLFSTDKKFPSVICWKKVPVSKWDSTVTMYWVMHTLQKYNIRYQDIRLSNFNIDGLSLLSMTKDDFISLEKEHGQVLYEELRERINSLETSNDDTQQNKKADIVRKPRGRGRPSKGGSRRNKQKGGKMVWEFLIDMLRDSKNEKLISWKDENRGIFKFESSGEVARIWGERKKNKNMNFEKMSRAMRYHYRSKILMPVEGERLVYRFGPGLDLSTGKSKPYVKTGDSSDSTDEY